MICVHLRRRQQMACIALLLFIGGQQQYGLSFRFCRLAGATDFVAKRARLLYHIPQGGRLRRKRPLRTQLRCENGQDEFLQLQRRVARLERLLSEQSKEIEALRSSLVETRTLVQAQAEIDASLMEDTEDPLNLRGDSGAGTDLDLRLLEYASIWLAVRQRVLKPRKTTDAPAIGASQSSRSAVGDFSTMRALMDMLDRRQRRPRSLTPKDDGSPTPGGGDVSSISSDGWVWEDGDGEYDIFDTDFDNVEDRKEGGTYGSWAPKRPPRTNQDAADAAGAGVVAALMEGRRRLIVEVDDAQLRYDSSHFCHEAMAEFVELLVLPLTTALENLNAEQNRCKIVIPGQDNVAAAKEAMVLDAPDSLEVVSLEEAKVDPQDRVVAFVAPRNWRGSKGKALKRVLAEAEDAAIVLINPTHPEKFLKGSQLEHYEVVYHLRPMQVNYLKPCGPLRSSGVGDGEGNENSVVPSIDGEKLLLESISEAVRAEENALAARAAACEGDSANDKRDDTGPLPCDAPNTPGAAAAAKIGGLASDHRSGVGAVLGIETREDGNADSAERAKIEATESSSESASAAAGAGVWDAPGDGFQTRVTGSWRDRRKNSNIEDIAPMEEGTLSEQEAIEASAIAVTVRQFPEAWEAFVDLDDGQGFRLCGTWDVQPPLKAVNTVVMDHILRVVMD